MRKDRDCPAINWKDCTNLRQANASPALKAKSAFANAILGPGSATLQGFAATPIGIEATRLKRSPRTIAESRSAMSSKVFGRSCSLFGTPSGMAAAWARHTAGLNVAWPLEVATVDLSQLGKSGRSQPPAHGAISPREGAGKTAPQHFISAVTCAATERASASRS